MKTHTLKYFVLSLLACPVFSSAIELNGVGRRIPAPVFAEWSAHFSAQNPNITIKYQAINAIEGINQVKDGTADFADTDIPLTKEDLEKNGLAQFPYMLTAITPIINLPGIYEGKLNLNGKTLAEIFIGKITNWNDPAIAATNTGIKLPSNPILVAHRTANGGGTYTLSSYLSKVSPEWQTKIGVGATLNWPVGVATENLYAMGDYIKKTPYSIGYSEISYARKNQLAYVRLQNAAGAFVSPHMASVEEAANNVRWNAANGFNESTTDEPGAGSWPMASASYIVIRKTSGDIPRRQALLSFLGWGLRVGDMDITRMDFLPMKRSILPQIRNSWNDTPLSLDGANVVTAAQVKELQSNGTLIVDARIPAEYEESHIPRALHIYYVEKSAKTANFNPQQDSFDLSKLPANKNTDIVFYCNAGPCWKGYKAAAAAVRGGYKKVHWFRGGLPEWKDKGYPIESSQPATAKK
jgi:phosphate transport system substrate-binding protein